MKKTLPDGRRTRLLWLAPMFVLLVGGSCSKESSGPTFATNKLPSDEQLRDRVDAVVEHTLNNRTLSTRTHNAWQVVHGILPYGRAFQIEHDGQRIAALDWLLIGGALKGWDIHATDQGVRADLVPGSKAAQGHPDQWIGYLSQGGADGLTGLSPDEKIVADGKTFTMGDLLRQGEWDLRPGMEACWTLMSESAYSPSDHAWTAGDGQHWTVERLVEMEAGAPVVGENASCGGTHRLYGLSVALNRYMQDTGKKPSELKGGWRKAEDVVEDCIHKAKIYQQPNGSFSTAFFARPGSSPEVDDTLHSTGHTLEWLCVALNDQQLQEPWVTAAVAKLCQLLEDNKDRELDCGALYHAARGLRLYRLRRFGPGGGATPIVAKAIGDSVHDGQKPSTSAGQKSDDAPPPPGNIGSEK